MEYIDVSKEELPQSFEIDLGVETFTLSFAYNTMGDFFTVSLYKYSETESEPEPMILGEKLVLNKSLWSDFSSSELPGPNIIPMDISGGEKVITFENFGEKVFLYIDNDVGELDG